MSHHEETGNGHHVHPHRNPDAEGASGPIPDDGKLLKRIEHWIHHNADHAVSYREWAARVREMGHEEVSLVLEEVAGDTDRQNEKLQKILGLLKTS